MVILTLIAFAAFVLPLILLAGCFLVPVFTGLPWRPSEPSRIRRALDLADVRPGETVFDLGSGDGRILLVAAEDYAARGVGIELSPIPLVWSWLRARTHSGGDQIEFRWGDCFRADLSEADVIIAYMTSAQAPRLREAIERTAHAGARVVTLAFEIPGWQPAVFDSEALVYVYRHPAPAGDLGTYLARAEADHMPPAPTAAIRNGLVHLPGARLSPIDL